MPVWPLLLVHLGTVISARQLNAGWIVVLGQEPEKDSWSTLRRDPSTAASHFEVCDSPPPKCERCQELDPWHLRRPMPGLMLGDWWPRLRCRCPRSAPRLRWISTPWTKVTKVCGVRALASTPRALRRPTSSGAQQSARCWRLPSARSCAPSDVSVPLGDMWRPPFALCAHLQLAPTPSCNNWPLLQVLPVLHAAAAGCTIQRCQGATFAGIQLVRGFLGSSSWAWIPPPYFACTTCPAARASHAACLPQTRYDSPSVSIGSIAGVLRVLGPLCSRLSVERTAQLRQVRKVLILHQSQPPKQLEPVFRTTASQWANEAAEVVGVGLEILLGKHSVHPSGSALQSPSPAQRPRMTTPTS